MRTCVVTHEALAQRDLLRLVAVEGHALVDRSGKLPGRGAWVKPERAAVERLVQKPGMLGRALELESPGALVTSDLLEQARAVTAASVLDLLSLAARSGCLASGGDSATAAVRAGEALALLVASDASEQSVASVRGARPELEVFALPLDRESLGHKIGKGARAVVAVKRGGPATALIHQLRRTEALR